MRIHVVTDKSELVDTIDVNEYDVSNNVQMFSMMVELKEILQRGKRMEEDGR